MSVRESTFLSVASTNHVERNTLAKVTRRLVCFSLPALSSITSIVPMSVSQSYTFRTV
jgi:hypothetical protein